MLEYIKIYYQASPYIVFVVINQIGWLQCGKRALDFTHERYWENRAIFANVLYFLILFLFSCFVLRQRGESACNYA